MMNRAHELLKFLKAIAQNRQKFFRQKSDNTYPGIRVLTRKKPDICSEMRFGISVRGFDSRLWYEKPPLP